MAEVNFYREIRENFTEELNLKRWRELGQLLKRRCWITTIPSDCSIDWSFLPHLLLYFTYLSKMWKKIFKTHLLTYYCYIPFLYFPSTLIFFKSIYTYWKILSNDLAFTFSYFLLQNSSFAMAQNALLMQPHITT